VTIWQVEMYWALKHVASHKSTFTNDDVFDEYERTHKNEKSLTDKRSYGTVVQKALKEDLMTPTGGYLVSRRRHLKMLVQVYKSNIFETFKQPWHLTLWNKFKNFLRKHGCDCV